MTTEKLCPSFSSRETGNELQTGIEHIDLRYECFGSKNLETRHSQLVKLVGLEDVKQDMLYHEFLATISSRVGRR